MSRKRTLRHQMKLRQKIMENMSKRIRQKSTCKRTCFCKHNMRTTQDNGIFDVLREKQIFHDLLVHSRNNEVIHAHKVILLNLGSKFEKAFLSRRGPRVQVIKLATSPEATRELVRFAYTGTCNIHRGNVTELMDLGRTYEIKGLLKLGGDFMVSELTHSNAVEMYKFAIDFFCPELIDHVKRFILQNFLHINSGSKGFGDCPTQDLEDLLRDDELNSSEEMLFEAIEKWAGQDVERQEALARLLKHVRFSLMQQTYFEQKVENSTLAQQKNAVMPIAQARSFFLKMSRARTSTISKLLQTNIHQKSRIPSEIVFTLGGWSANPSGPSACIETFDIRACRWHNMKLSMPAPRAYHGLAVIGHKVYIVGGYDGLEYYSAMSMYDPSTNEWFEKAPMYHARCYVSVTVLNGKIYAIGGYNGRSRMSSVECYDPHLNLWTLLPPMRFVRSDACAVATNDRIYVIGGFTGHGILDSVEVLDPSAMEWTFGPRMNAARSGVNAVVHQQNIYVLGGFNGQERLKSVERLNPLASELRGWTFVAEMLTQRSNFGSTVIDDKILVMGGFEGSGVIGNTEAYCAQSNVWSAYPMMNMRRSALSAVTLTGLPNSAFFVNRHSELER